MSWTWSITCAACAPSHPPPSDASPHHAGYLARRVGEHRDVQEERRELRRADLAAGDDPRRRCLARRPAELGAEQVHDAGRVGRVEHPARLGGVAGERLLAQHVLARRDGFERDRRVRVRRAWRSRPRRHRAVRAPRRAWCTRSGRRSAAARSRVFSGSRPTSATHVEPGGAQRAEVRDAAEPRPDDRNAAS